jgi:hypothetical protein
VTDAQVQEGGAQRRSVSDARRLITVPEFNRQGAEDAKGLRDRRSFLLEKHPGVLFLGADGVLAVQIWNTYLGCAPSSDRHWGGARLGEEVGR